MDCRARQWDDGGNALALAPGLVMCHERSTETIARLEAAGVAVIQVPGSELASSRGGPRCMACPVGRDRRRRARRAGEPTGRRRAGVARIGRAVPVTPVTLTAVPDPAPVTAVSRGPAGLAVAGQVRSLALV